jgi:hypothetical protein
MRKLRRIAKAMVKAFPTVCMFDAEHMLAGYRAGRGASGRDWEGDIWTTQMFIRAAIRSRHYSK